MGRLDFDGFPKIWRAVGGSTLGCQIIGYCQTLAQILGTCCLPQGPPDAGFDLRSPEALSLQRHPLGGLGGGGVSAVWLRAYPAGGGHSPVLRRVGPGRDHELVAPSCMAARSSALHDTGVAHVEAEASVASGLVTPSFPILIGGRTGGTETLQFLVEVLQAALFVFARWLLVGRPSRLGSRWRARRRACRARCWWACSRGLSMRVSLASANPSSSG